MPTNTLYNYSAGNYTTRISCSDCDSVVEVEHDRRYDSVRSSAADDIFRFHTGNGRYLARCRECERAHVRRWRENRRVVASSVPSVPLEGDRTFGVELELCSPIGISELQSRISRAGLRGWRVKSDCSISAPYGMHGAEVVSPALAGAAGRRAVESVCQLLSEIGCTVNRSTGTHVHHGASDLSIDDWKRLVVGWTDNQSVIDRLVSASRRGGRNTYCGRWTGNDLAHLRNCQTLDDIRRVAYSVSRYKTLNVCSFPRHGTVEVRQHQGTIDARKILAWVEFGQAMIDQAKQTPVTRSSSTASLFDKLATLSQSTREYLAGRELALA